MKALLLAALLCSTASLTLYSNTSYASAADNDRVCADTDCSKELRRLIRLARSGSGDAAALVAMAHATGDGLEQSNEQAIRYLRMGVRQRNAMAVFLMSDWLRNGFMLEQDLAESQRLLDLAVDLKYAPAQYAKAVQLLQAEQDDQLPEAINLLELATEQRLASAMLLLAQLKQYGAGVEQDLPGAAELYRKLVLAGQVSARPYLQEVTALLAVDQQHQTLVDELRQVENIEVIRVTGQALQANNMLEGIVRRLTATGQYDSRSVGSRIRGVSCDQSGSNCGVIRPDSSSGSISEALAGGK